MEQLHDHNQRTYENICRMYDEGIQRVAIVQPTGSGKSLLMAKLIEDNPNSRFFVLSTSHKINDQFKEKLDEEMLEKLEFNIYCNMPNMKQEIMESLKPDYIFLDEMHRALAKEWSKGILRLLEMYPNAKVLGLSATPIRYLDRCRNVAEELFGGNLACDMSLSQAILDGILPMARYVCGVYSYEKDAESLNKKIEKSCNSDEEKKELLKELKILKENLDKGHGVSDIFRKYIMSGNEKFVVFLKNTTHLRAMKPVIEKWFTDAGFSVRLYEVHCKNTDRDKEFQKFKEDTEDGIIKLCLSVNMISEGIHGDIDGVIMLRDTISPNMYFQMIGRAFACGKKSIPLIFDLVANSQIISDASNLSFPNELRGEIEKQKEECEKEGKEYDPCFDMDEFIVTDEFMDVVSGFRAIEGRLIGDWENGLRHFDKYVREHNGDVLVPSNYKDKDGFCTGEWVGHRRQDFKNGILSDIRVKELNRRGFVWDSAEYAFDIYTKALKQYRDRKGDCLVPQKHIEIVNGMPINLGKWCVAMQCSKRGSNIYKLTDKMEKQLNQLGFIWDTSKYKFENNVKMVQEYYKKNGKYPVQSDNNSEIKKLGSFIIGEKMKMRNEEYPDWKMKLINEYLPNFSCETKSDEVFNKFMYYASLFKKKYGHVDIKSVDIIDGYNIGTSLGIIKKSFNNKKLSGAKINRLNKLGIFLGNKSQLHNQMLFDKNMELVRLAVNDGMIINKENQIFKEKNLYLWIKNTVKNKYVKGELSDEQIEIIEKLIGKPLYKINNGNFVKVIDVIEKREIAICKSQSMATNILEKLLCEKISKSVVDNRLNGKVITPYKGRFMFYYATDEEVKKYLEENKVS